MKLYWGSSVGRSYTPDHVTDLIRLFARSPHPIYWRPIHGDALIERSRSRAATEFLATDAEVFVSVDTDIRFDWTDLVQIAEQAVEYGIVVGAYTTRSPLRTFLTSQVHPHQPIEFATDPTPVEIQWGATGFMAVHRRVFEAVAMRQDQPLCHAGEPLAHRPFFLPFVVETPNGPILLSEDYAFCERARQEGFPTYLNPAVRLGHVGDYCYRLEDLTAPRPESPFPILLERLNDGSPASFAVRRERRPSSEDVQRLVAASA